ncbi:hypothetical protein [Algoriphagus mannitolivorans]|uniref:hypothetical protein n=1 Tax=Algoriphagus mannitolivorans TaxID=226504 RepID=UPI000419DDCF|nr:hypothetical protein [Algoriphagus mannitolivorans]
MKQNQALEMFSDSFVFLFKLVSLTIFSSLIFSCTPEKKLIIPQEPTIWVVSEIYVPNEEKFNGLVGYKIIPVNPGNINARPTWKLDHKGKYEVGQKVDFFPLLDKNTASK